MLDDGEDIRVRLRWERKKRGEVSLEAILRQYDRKLARTGKARIDPLREGFLPKRFRADKNLAAFRRTEPAPAHGLAWHCQTCGAVAVAEVMTPDRRLAHEVLASLADHREDGQRLWSVYGFAFLAPSAYNLVRPALAPGCLAYEFRGPRRAWLKVDRWALASEWLRKVPLDAWPRELFGVLRLNAAGLEQEQTGLRGHAAWRFARPAGWRRLSRQPRIDGLVWACPEQDKVYAVIAGGGPEDLAEGVAASIGCHA